MATLKRFEDIEAWKTARELTRAVYSCSKVGASQETSVCEIKYDVQPFQLCQNISEGFERGGTAEFVQFLAISKGRVRSRRSSMLLFDQGYINDDQFRSLKQLAASTKRLIAGLMAYLRRCGIRGSKV